MLNIVEGILLRERLFFLLLIIIFFICIVYKGLEDDVNVIFVNFFVLFFVFGSELFFFLDFMLVVGMDKMLFLEVLV